MKPPAGRDTDHVAKRSRVYPLPRKGLPPSFTRCHYCTAWAENRDHVVPKSAGGADSWWNVVPSCEACNQEKKADIPTCDCEFCVRAVDLWWAGFRRPRAVKPSLRKVEGVWVLREQAIDGKMKTSTYRTMRRATNRIGARA